MKNQLSRSLYGKIIAYGVVLVMISVVLANLFSYIGSKNIITGKLNDINKILFDAALEKTNTYLGEIATIVNLSIKNDYYDSLFDPSDKTEYEGFIQKNNYTQYLQNLILPNQSIDAVIIFNDHLSILAANTVNRTYSKYREKEFYNGMQEIVSKQAGGQFFLDNYTEDMYKRITVVSPVYKEYSNEIQACVAVVFSENFSRDLQFSGDNFLLRDQLGTYTDMNNEIHDIQSLEQSHQFESSLNFDGWVIMNISSVSSVQNALKEYLYLSLKMTCISVLLMVAVIVFVSKKVVYPVVKLNNQIKSFQGNESGKVFLNDGKSRLRFRNKLLIFYSVMVTILVTAVTIGFYYKTKDIINEKVGYVFEYNTNLMSQQMDLILRNYFRTAVEIGIDGKVQSWLSSGRAFPDDSNYQDKVGEMILYKQMQNKGILNVSIFDSQESLLYSAVYDTSFVAKPYIMNDLAAIRENLSKPLWRTISENYFNKSAFRIGMHIRGIKDKSSVEGFMGYILLDFDQDIIRQILNTYNENSKSMIFLTDTDGHIVMESNGSNNISYASVRNQLLQNLESHYAIEYEGVDYHIIRKKVNLPNWDLFVVIPMNEYMKENNRLIYYSLLLLLIMVMLSFMISYEFSGVLLKGLSNLTDMVRKVKEGDLSVRFHTRTGDEIEEVGKSFNDMLDRLNITLKEKINTEIKAKEYELNLLQSQINPHFLYNTLKTVQYMVFMKDSRSEKMIKLIISLFKNGINRGNTLVTIDDEMKYVKTYLEIQNIRFSNKYQTVIDIADEIYNLKIPKLTLQPIIENAIYHGLDVKPDQGMIWLTGKKIENKVVIIIKDNGVGIRPEKLEDMKRQLSGESEQKSIGLCNVNERIRLFFGNQYGVHIESRKNHGTEVTIEIPVII